MIAAHAPAAADDRSAVVSAREHAGHSTTFYVASELMPLPTVSGRVGGEGVLRAHRRAWASELRLGAGGGFSTTAGGTVYGARGGASLGRAFALGTRVVVAAMASYDGFVLAESGDPDRLFLHRLAIHTPVSVLLYPHVLVEVSPQLGLQLFQGQRDLALVIAPRVGLVF